MEIRKAMLSQPMAGGTCNISPGDYIVKDRSGRFFVYDEKEFKENFTEVDSNG